MLFPSQNNLITQSFECFDCRDLEKTQTSIEDHVKEHASVVIYPSQQFFIVVELNERTRYGVKFFDENLIFCPLQDEPSSIQHSTRETQLHPGGKSGPFYNPDDSRMKLQEGYYQNPSITTEQTILSESVNLERKGSFDSNNPSNLSYPKQSINTSLIEDYSQPNYLQPSYLSQLYTEQIDSFDSSFVQQDGEFNEFEFFHELSCTHTDTRIVH